MVNPLAPMAEKLSVNFCFMASMAVLIPTNAMIPNAIIATVRPVRTRFPRIVLYARDNVSESRILPRVHEMLELAQQYLRPNPQQDHQRRQQHQHSLETHAWRRLRRPIPVLKI